MPALSRPINKHHQELQVTSDLGFLGSLNTRLKGQDVTPSIKANVIQGFLHSYQRLGAVSARTTDSFSCRQWSGRRSSSSSRTGSSSSRKTRRSKSFRAAAAEAYHRTSTWTSTSSTGPASERTGPAWTRTRRSTRPFASPGSFWTTESWPEELLGRSSSVVSAFRGKLFLAERRRANSWRRTDPTTPSPSLEKFSGQRETERKYSRRRKIHSKLFMKKLWSSLLVVQRVKKLGSSTTTTATTQAFASTTKMPQGS